MAEGQHRLELAEKRLEEEREKQAGIRKDFEETEAAYNESAAEVKTVEDEAKGLQKELAAFEKQDIQLQEQKKHFTAKMKKVKKSIADVRVLSNLAWAICACLSEGVAGLSRQINGFEHH